MKILITSLLGLALAGCSSRMVASNEPAQSPAQVSPAPNAETLKKLADKEIGKGDDGRNSTVKPAQPAPAAKHQAHVSKRSPISSDKALGWLKNGNIRFTKHSLRNDGESVKDRTRLVSGQNPHTIILSCSDSRVPPEVVFDQKLGEVFVIRTAGESLDAAGIASIEYALEHLGTNLILVLGHESCGAVKAALATLGGADAGSPWLNKLVADLHPHLKSFEGKTVSSGTLVEVWANTEGVAKDLVERSQIVRDALNTGDVKIQTAVYHLGSGVVEFK